LAAAARSYRGKTVVSAAKSQMAWLSEIIRIDWRGVRPNSVLVDGSCEGDCGDTAQSTSVAPQTAVQLRLFSEQVDTVM
jgi:hypothetical protein